MTTGHQNRLNVVVTVLCVFWVAFQMYTASAGVFPALAQRSIHLNFALVIIFLTTSAHGKRTDGSGYASIDQIGLMIISAIPLFYISWNYLAIWTQTSDPSQFQIVLSYMLIIGLMEAARRTIGYAIPVIVLFFIIYAKFGNYFPDFVRHRGYSFAEIATYQALSLQGIFGIALGVIATFVFLFILYAAILNVSGAGEVFIKIATRFFGGVRGGPAKVAILASAAFGSISGSAVANVAGTGTFTIPLMKRIGYKPSFAAAAEAVASSGGQFMPPLMGASAFLISEITSIPFWQIAAGALIPAVLYYFAAFVMVDLEAAKSNIKGIEKSELPSVRPLIKQSWHLLLSPVFLVFFLLVLHWSPMKSALWAIVVTLISMFVNPKSRVSIKQLIAIMRQGAMGTVEVSIACASVGIVIGIMTQTGLGYQLSAILVGAAQGNLLVLLLLTMFASLILGMGLPTVAAYLVLSVTVAPALVSMGVNLLAAHLFIFYFGIISAITPPVALASMVAAGIAEEKVWPTSVAAFRLGMSAFVLPFMFVYNPALILQGSWTEVLLSIIVGAVGVFALSVGLSRFLITKLDFVRVIILFIITVLLVAPNLLSNLIGFALFLLLVLDRYWAQRKMSSVSIGADSSDRSKKSI